MIISESHGAVLVYRFVLIGSDCLHGSGWRCVFLTHFQESVSPTVRSAESGLPPTTPPCPPPSSLPRLCALIIPRPIHPHLGRLTVCMSRASNSSGSFNEGRRNLKVRTEARCSKAAGSNTLEAAVIITTSYIITTREHQQICMMATFSSQTNENLFLQPCNIMQNFTAEDQNKYQIL